MNAAVLELRSTGQDQRGVRVIGIDMDDNQHAELRVGVVCVRKSGVLSSDASAETASRTLWSDESQAAVTGVPLTRAARGTPAARARLRRCTATSAATVAHPAGTRIQKLMMR